MPSPTSALVVILGASQYQEPFQPSPALEETAKQIRTYFSSAFGLARQDQRLLFLFDDPHSSSDQLSRLVTFVKSGRSDCPGLTDVIVWYVGHGAFDHRQNYCLTVRSTAGASLGPTSIRITDLGHLLTNPDLGVTAGLRLTLVLDACYSGSAGDEFMGDEYVPLEEEIPGSGVAILCSSSKRLRSYYDSDQGTTIFSGAILEVLRNGIPSRGKLLTLHDLRDAAHAKIARHPDPQKRVRPIVCDPDSEKGAVSKVPLFPNPAFIQLPARTSRKITGIVFDLDGTLLVGYQYSWSLLWKVLGYPDEMRKELFRSFDKREIKYWQWCEECCRRFRQRGLTDRMVRQAQRQHGARKATNYGRMMNTLHDWGIKCGIVSGGVDAFLPLLKRGGQSLGGDFRHIFINQLKFDKTGRLVAIVPTDYDLDTKWDGVLEFCNREGLDPKTVVFVGDSINDYHAARRAQFSIAFNGASHGEIKSVVDRSFAKNDLVNVLQCIRDWERDPEPLFPKPPPDPRPFGGVG